ncbi:oligosaccharide flippase family protein [Flaviaesturariibacter aridisoli]|uniref:oligosaccharide flippase family protein n=1 Tax=Flaviaesturariibacter aridisoli TaxID=2545761 RepID=UPI00140510FE|nr:oligosaccharide flippase family protein [Flaviaesturariibacter aridisoli]
MSLKKNLAFNFLLSLSQVLFPLLSIPWLSRVLDPAGLGRVQFIDGLTYYFIVLAEAGIVTHAIREVARCRHDRSALKQLVSELLTLHLLTTLASACLYGLTVYLLYDRIGDVRLLLYSLSFLLINGFACEWYFWGLEEFRYITLRSLLVRALALLSLFLLVRQPEHYVRYYALIAGTAIVVLAWNVLRMLAQTGISFRKLQWRKHLRITRVTYAVSLVYSIPLLLDNVLLGVLSGTAVVAFYAYALKIVRLLSAFITDSFLVLYPRTVALLQEADERLLQRNLRLSAEGLLLLALPAGAGIWLVADSFTAVYFGPRFASVAGHLRILSVYPLLITLGLFLNKQVLMPRNQERFVLYGLLAGAASFLLLAFLLCRRWGSYGMAWALVGSEVVVVLCNALFVRRLHRGLVPVPARTLAAAVASVALFLATGWCLRRLDLGPWPYLLALLPACLLWFILVLKAFRLEVSELLFAALRPKQKPSVLG